MPPRKAKAAAAPEPEVVVEPAEEAPAPSPKPTVARAVPVEAAPPVVAEAAPVAVETERMVTVCPRKHIPNMRVGNKWYSFRQGKSERVPSNVAQILKERDII